MDASARIGLSIHIKGDVTAQEPLTIAGHLEGTVQVEGHDLTVTPEGRLNATLAAETIIIGGTVNGRVQARARIIVCETAVIEGDLLAPVISLAEGATVHGRVETAVRTAAVLPLAS